MKLKLNNIALAVAASVAIAAAAPALAADLVVTDPYGAAVKDPYGKCVLSIGGVEHPDCGAPAPKMVRTSKTLTLAADANFDFDKAVLKPAGKAALGNLVAEMKQSTKVDGILIVGHTDSKGTDAYNQRLSERRASAAKEYLVAEGVPAGIITAKGMGESQPIADNATAAGRAQNRRVEITVDAENEAK